jgi:hypothetical protein
MREGACSVLSVLRVALTYPRVAPLRGSAEGLRLRCPAAKANGSSSEGAWSAMLGTRHLNAFWRNGADVAGPILISSKEGMHKRFDSPGSGRMDRNKTTPARRSGARRWREICQKSLSSVTTRRASASARFNKVSILRSRGGGSGPKNIMSAIAEPLNNGSGKVFAGQEAHEPIYAGMGYALNSCAR